MLRRNRAYMTRNQTEITRNQTEITRNQTEITRNRAGLSFVFALGLSFWATIPNSMARRLCQVWNIIIVKQEPDHNRSTFINTYTCTCL